MKLLLVEDDREIQEMLGDYLRTEAYEVVCASNGRDACRLFDEGGIGLVLLDLMIPQVSGMDVMEHIRKKSVVPIIILSARDTEADKTLGLGMGADDYITKPFNILEVKARIKAIMRRTGNAKPKEEENPKIVESGDLKLDCESRRLFILGKEVNVTAKEFDLLELLVMNPNKVYSRENLLNLVWGYEYPGDVRTVDVHVRRLREKIEANPSEPKYVHTKWGVGYYYQS